MKENKSLHSICRWTFNAGKGGFVPDDMRPEWNSQNLNTVDMIKLVRNRVAPRLPDNIELGIEVHYDNEFDEKTAPEIADALVDSKIYLAMVLDRETCQIAVISSSEGGVEIEKVASESPEKIHKIWVDPVVGLMPFQARQICFKLGLKDQAFKDGVKCITNLYKLYVGEDATLAEINPMIVTKDGRVLAIDAKVNLDDDAVFRQKGHPDLRDLNEEEPLEIEAHKNNLSYIKLSGSVGCMVNGAGLAMATMDLIKLCGGEPANFLDVGGAASAEAVEKAFRILVSDKDVKCVLINIFGGIVRCDRVASGVVEAIRNIGDIGVPVVVRLEGTNAKEGIEILNNSGLDFHTATGFHEAAQRAVELLGGGE